ncbi:MAG: Glu/Leu/Phe/Val dehydrogenase [Chitinophagaceae bacterium]|nr:MAG: Glu/Leu/Phe/Val dehydrogenase [Chitinophagaceae bacterium]
MSLFQQMQEMEHEQVVFGYDEATGLKCIIGIHNTVLGPSLGGTRFWNYATDADAVKDVLRLSRGMTYKAAISGINLGGGKAVIIGDPYRDKSEALWRRFGKFVNSLGGKYITAEDVGTSSKDMEYVAMETKYVTGVPEFLGGSGDPSPVTAYTTFLGIKASLKKSTGNDSVGGKKVLVQGVGHVGQYLVKYLKEEGAEVYVSDIHEDKLSEIKKEYPDVKVVPPESVYDVDVDIYAPCALGATINSETIPKLKCSIIAGAANNQLENEIIHGNMLKEKGIYYAPDFLINAGGLINVYCEWTGYNRERAMGTAEMIYDRTLEIYAKADEENISTHQAALQIAHERIQQVAKLNSYL